MRNIEAGRRSPWPALFAIFVFALLLRLAYFAAIHNGPLGNGDSPAYEDLALKIAQHQPYQTVAAAGPGGFPSDLQRPPGYPLFLALVNGGAVSRVRTAVIQSFLGAFFAAGLAAFFFLIAGRMAGTWAGIFYAADWVTIIHTPLVISETLYAILLGLAICVYALYLVRRKGMLSIVAGILLALAALTKPAGELLLLAFFIAWFFSKPRKAAGLLFLASYAACVIPWMARNQQQHGVFALSAIGVADVYFYTAQASLHTYPIAGDLANNELNDEVTRLDRDWKAQSLVPSERIERLERDSVPLILHHPGRVIEQSVIGLARTCIGSGFVTVSDSLPHPPGRLARALLAAIPLAEIAALWILAIYGLWHGLRSKMAAPLRSVHILLLGCLIFTLLPAASSLGQSRFRIPAVPALAALAGLGVATARARRDRVTFAAA